MRAISLRISTGRSNCASVSRSSGLNANGASPSVRPLRSSARTVPVSAGAGGGAQHFHAQRAGRIVGRGERARARECRRTRSVIGRCLERLREAFDEFGAAAEIGAVRQPDELDVVRIGEEARDRRQRLGAVDRMRHRLDLMQAHARRACGLERNVARAFGQRNERHGATIVSGARDDVVGGAQARIPGGGRRPAVVDQDRDRRACLRGRERRMPQRAGGGDDDERGERKPHQREPPRRARRGLLLGRDFEQEPCRRKIDAARARRDQSQQPPQHRQRQQADEDERFGKAERQSADHAGTLGSAGAARCVPLSAVAAPMRACSASSSSLAGRSVRWMVKLQPSRSVSRADFGAVALARAPRNRRARFRRGRP